MPYSTRLLLLLAFLATACNQAAQPGAAGASTAAANDKTELKKKADWWKEPIVYQLYLRSFQDSNGDGAGDLKGILQRFDYLEGLGIGTVWLNPSARSSRTSPYGNYYYWWPARKGTPPACCNTFDGKKNAWQYDSAPNSYYLQEMNREALSRYTLLTVTAGAGRNLQEARLFVASARKEPGMTYHFDAVGGGDKRTHSYQLDELKDVFARWEKECATTGGQAIYLGSHDQPRIVSRFGNDQPAFRAPSAKLLNTFILSRPSTPYCYYGEELGMTNIGFTSMFTSMADYRDAQTRNGYQLLTSQKGAESAYLQLLSYFSRDNSRTPFQWSQASRWPCCLSKLWWSRCASSSPDPTISHYPHPLCQSTAAAIPFSKRLWLPPQPGSFEFPHTHSFHS